MCPQRGVELREGHLMIDHVHMCLNIPPKFSVSDVIGFLKGKSAVRIHRELLKIRRMTNLHFWARGYCVSTVGLDEDGIRAYIRNQDKLDSGEQELELEQNKQPQRGFLYVKSPFKGEAQSLLLWRRLLTSTPYSP